MARVPETPGLRGERKAGSMNQVLKRRFIRYLLPTLAIMAMMPVSQIVESVILSRCVGSRTMASVSLASPMLLLATAVYYFLGGGGAAEYTLALNEGDENKAAAVFKITILIGTICGVMMTGISLIFFDPLSHLLCRDPGLFADFQSYFRIVIFAIPPLIFFLTLTGLLVPLGRPATAAGTVTIVGALQAALTYIYTACYGLRAEGAALARLLSCVIGAMIMFAWVLYSMPGHRQDRGPSNLKQRWTIVMDILKKGNSEGMSVCSMAFRFFWTFSVGAIQMGTDAVLAFSVCIQMASVDSIIQGTLIGTSIPLIALLHDQEDYHATGQTLKHTIRIQFILSAVWFVICILIARPLIYLFQIHDEVQIETAVSVLRIYSVTYLFRGSYTLFRNYLKILQIRDHAWKLTVGGLVANGAYALCSMLGGNALWWANPLASLGLLIYTYALNLKVVRGSEGKWHSVLLIPQEQEALRTINASLGLNREKIARFAEQFQGMCEENGMDAVHAVISTFALEELLLHVIEDEERKDYADINARIYPDRMVIDFRTLGPAFQPEEMKLLKRISRKITHRNISGMNCTRLELARQDQEPGDSPEA